MNPILLLEINEVPWRLSDRYIDEPQAWAVRLLPTHQQPLGAGASAPRRHQRPANARPSPARGELVRRS